MSSAGGRLGLGHTRGALEPTLIEGLLQQQITFVAAGESHSAAVDRSGRAYTWGRGAFYKLGHGDEADAHTPRLIETLGGIPIIQVSVYIYIYQHYILAAFAAALHLLLLLLFICCAAALHHHALLCYP